jgi:hypothetical protein
MSRRNRALVAILTKIPRPLVWMFAKNYIAGPTLEDGLRAVRDLNARGCRATMDVLGEDVFNEAEVREYVDAYKEMIRRIVEEHLDANISVKPTAMGLKMSRELTLEAVSEVLDEAAIRDFTKEKLASYKVPRRVLFFSMQQPVGEVIESLIGVSLLASHGLLASPATRHLAQMRLGDLDIPTEHARITHLQVRDPRGCT